MMRLTAGTGGIMPFGIAGEIITLYFLVGNCVVFGMGYVLGLILKFKQIHK